MSLLAPPSTSSPMPAEIVSLPSPAKIWSCSRVMSSLPDIEGLAVARARPDQVVVLAGVDVTSAPSPPKIVSEPPLTRGGRVLVSSSASIDVVARAAVDEVAAAGCVDHIVAAAADEGLAAGIAFHQVVAVAAVEPGRDRRAPRQDVDPRATEHVFAVVAAEQRVVARRRSPYISKP